MKKIIAFSLSLLLLGSQIGFAISQHLCGGKKMGSSISFFPESISCGMELAEKPCFSDSRLSFSKKDCCKDQHQLFRAEEDFKQEVNRLATHKVIASFLKPDRLIYTLFSKSKKVESKAHSPPYTQYSIQAFFQVFLL